MIEIPRFKSEDEERDFWATHDSVDFLEGAEQVNLEYVGREREFILIPSAESEPFQTYSIRFHKRGFRIGVGGYGAASGATPGMEIR
jgi:hypothetical protein